MHPNMSYNIVHKPSQLSKGALQLQKKPHASLHKMQGRLGTGTGSDKLRDHSLRHSCSSRGPVTLTTSGHSIYWVGTFSQKWCPSVNQSTPALCKLLGSTRGCGLQCSGHRGCRWRKCPEPPELALTAHPAPKKLCSHYLFSLVQIHVSSSSSNTEFQLHTLY